MTSSDSKELCVLSHMGGTDTAETIIASVIDSRWKLLCRQVITFKLFVHCSNCDFEYIYGQ